MEGKSCGIPSRVRYSALVILIYISNRVSIYVRTRRQSNQGKQGRGNDIIRLVSRFDIEYYGSGVSRNE